MEILLYFDKEKDMQSDLNMPHGEMSDFVSFSLFRFTLVIKLRNFDFKIIFSDKIMMSDLILLYQTVSDLV